MSLKSKYDSFKDFERDEYLRVMSFYDNLEDIMEDRFFDEEKDVKQDCDDEESDDDVKELEF